VDVGGLASWRAAPKCPQARNSTEGKNLRAAHLFALHSHAQVERDVSWCAPLLVWSPSRKTNPSDDGRTRNCNVVFLKSTI
jgi:hypothetical protein